MGQAFVHHAPERRGRGRPTRLEHEELPPSIQQALVLRAAEASWIDCASGAGIDVRNLRKWRQHPLAEPFLNEQIRGNLQEAQNLFAEAAPRLAERLIKLVLMNERGRGIRLLVRSQKPSKSCRQELLINNIERHWTR